MINRVARIIRALCPERISIASAMRVSGAIRPLQGTQSWVVSSDELLRSSATPLQELTSSSPSDFSIKMSLKSI